MGVFKSLNRQQKEAVGLLQVGTFLEYFDLMLYVHMAVLLNELFFPKTDPHTASLVAAFAFCSTYVLRPFGALLFGWIGDRLGRKATVVITTMMMSISCAIMANVPTYTQIGISAAWIVTLCRVFQGIASMNEIIGAQIYVTEITKPPAQYVAVSFIGVSSALGSVFALGIATLVTHFDFNWRSAFWIGAGIAVVGSVARTRLRETPEFLEARQKRNNTIQKQTHNQTVLRKTMLAYFFLYCGWPLSFYISFVYFNTILKEHGYSSEDIVFHNFLLSIISLVVTWLPAHITHRIHPLKILKLRGNGLFLLTLCLPFLIMSSYHYLHIFGIQAMLLIFALSSIPADSIFLKYFPTLKRFTIAGFLYALKSAFIYMFVSFGTVYVTKWFGVYGLWFIILPVTLGFLWGIRHFEKLEGLRPDKSLRNKDDVLHSRAA